jgi:chemotaxis protein MotB
MIPPRKQAMSEETTDAWLMSYADMITLLLCFFIIFVSVSEPKKDKFSLITEGLANKFGSVDMSTPLAGVFSTLQATMENHQIFRDVAITKNEQSIEMELATGSFFQPRSAEIAKDKLPILTEMAAGFKSGAFLDYRIVVEGHTNDMATDNPQFASNWELSGARATRLVRYFIEQGIAANKLVAVSFGDTRPKLPNRDGAGDPIEANRFQNERMVIKFERDN